MAPYKAWGNHGGNHDPFAGQLKQELMELNSLLLLASKQVQDTQDLQEQRSKFTWKKTGFTQCTLVTDKLI